MKFPKAYSSDKKYVNVIIETPYKSRNKFAYDKETGLFKLKTVVPSGLEFPCDMGFIPQTTGADGDPLDALVFMTELTFPGCLVECRLIGVIMALQSEEGGIEKRNDRFLFVPANMSEYDHLQHINDVNENKLDAIVGFFEEYNKKDKKQFRVLDLLDADEAHEILKQFKN